MTKQWKRMRARWCWKWLGMGRRRRAAAKLTPDELMLAFAVAREDGWFEAVMQVIEDHIADNVEMIANPELVDRHGALASEAGAIEALLALKLDFETRRVAASEGGGLEEDSEDDGGGV